MRRENSDVLFLAKSLKASRVNLLMNDFAAGLPSPLAFLGLGDAIARACRVRTWSAGVLPILHELTVSEGRTKAEAAPTRSSDVFAPIEIPEDLVGSLDVSVLFDLPDVTDPDQVAEQLVGRRIAGGAIHNQTIKVERVTPDGSVFRQMPRGYALIPAQRPKSGIVATGSINDLGAVAAELYTVGREPGSGLFAPVAVGHRLLEDPATAPQRKNTRDPEIPHVFVEPAVGIAELVSVRSKRLTGRNEAALRDLLWRWQAEGTWIVAHSNYHPDNLATISQEQRND